MFIRDTRRGRKRTASFSERAGELNYSDAIVAPRELFYQNGGRGEYKCFRLIDHSGTGRGVDAEWAN